MESNTKSSPVLTVFLPMTLNIMIPKPKKINKLKILEKLNAISSAFKECK